jgi:hypothetical protein
MEKPKTELEKLEAGEIYNFSDKEVAARKMLLLNAKNIMQLILWIPRADGNIFQNGLVL